MSKHVDFSTEDIVIVDHNQIKQFIKQSYENLDNPKYRFCMHDSPDNILQEMFIVRRKGEYYRPDRHKLTPETHLILRGEEAVVLLDEVGRVLDIIFLKQNSGALAYRINAPIYHMTVALTEAAVDYEIKPGPFTKEINEYPDWSPSNEEQEKVKKFMEYIIGEIKMRRKYV